MPNAFDQFDQKERNPFDQFDEVTPEVTKPYTFWQAMKDIPVIEEPGTNMVPTKKGAITAARGVAEQLPLAGMTVGGLVTGTATLPAGPVAIPGSIAGGILGYGLGEKGKHIVNAGLDWLEGKKGEKKTVVQEMIDSGVDLVAGAEMTAGGMVLNKFVFEPVFRGGQWGFRTINSYLKKTGTPGLTEQAADKWVAMTSNGNIYAKNQEEAKALEESIPGLKFTYGQQSKDPKAISLERSQIRGQGEAKTSADEQRISNDSALKTYYEKTFNSNEGIDDFISAVQGKKEILEKGVEAAQTVATGAQTKLAAKAKAPDLLATNLQAAVKLEGTAVKGKVAKIYDLIPDDISIDSSGMIDKFKVIATPTSAVESNANFPKVLWNSLDKYGIKGTEGAVESQIAITGKMPFKELRGLRTEILNEARVEGSKIVGRNPAKERRLELMRQEVEEAIDSLGDSNQFGDEVANTYRMASKAYREYHDIYKKGSIAGITRKGSLGEESNMTPEQVLGTVFDKGNVKAADQLIQAVGETKAKEMVSQYANYDLLRKATNPMTGEIDRNGLMRWVAQNRPILKRYGLENEYSDIVNAKRIVDEVTLLKTTFEKNQAAKVLGTDPQKAIETIFSGRGALNSAQTTKDVLALVKGNKAAENGFKQAFADYAVSKLNSTLVEATASPTGSFTQFNKLYQKLSPAMRVLYTDKEMAVLLKMKRAYEIALRNTKSPIGGGSDTYELSTQMIATMSGPMLTSSYKMVNAIRVVGRIFEKYQSDQISKVINKAIFNPEYADTLLLLANGPKPVAEKRLANLIGANLMEETVRNKKETR